VRLLLIEDSPKVGKLVSRVLTEEGYEVDWRRDGAEIEQLLEQGQHALAILDWMLPGLDGLALLREIRALGQSLPILMLTARGEVKERALCLDAGADDYLVKPFSVEELLARVRALLRRSSSATLRVGRLTLDRLGRRAFVDDQQLELTSRELTLLSYLAERGDAPVPRAELLGKVWGLPAEATSNVLDVAISRLRQKLGVLGESLQTERGRGYSLLPSEPRVYGRDPLR
jgi:DNA-binding response OmpR family regulator